MKNPSPQIRILGGGWTLQFRCKNAEKTDLSFYRRKKACTTLIFDFTTVRDCLFVRSGVWALINHIDKVEIFLEQRKVTFLSPSKICENYF